MGKLSLRQAAELCAMSFTVKYPDGSEEKLWVRTRTQSETEEALESTAEKRLALRERYAKGSVNYRLLVSNFDSFTTEELAKMVSQIEIVDLQRKAQTKVAQPMPLDVSKYSSKTALAKAEDEYEIRKQEYQKLVQAEVDKLTEQRIQVLVTEPRDQLIEMLVRMQIQVVINEETSKLLEDYTIFDCIRKGEDHSQRYFESIDEIPDAPQIRNMLIDCIDQVDAIEPIEIKN